MWFLIEGSWHKVVKDEGAIDFACSKVMTYGDEIKLPGCSSCSETPVDRWPDMCIQCYTRSSQ